MKKIAASAFIILSFVIYSLVHGKSFDSISPVTSTPGSTTTGSISSTPNDSSSGSSSSSGATTYKDGSYTGVAANAFYGNIQVRATISGGKLTKVEFLDYPSDQGRSVEINQYADPILAQEAVSIQSANVDMVSGASDTSQAFIQSLSSALAQAQS